jgi:3-methylfumaryl-CoA hydratase
LAFRGRIEIVNDWTSWIGSTDVHTDTITETLRDRFVAVIGRHESNDDPDVVPLGLHWCLAVPAIDNDGLAPDGHPVRGVLVPPIPSARRVWAGGELAIHEPLRLHDRVSRRSTIQDVRVTEGRTGALSFVVIRHDYETSRGLSISERQDIGYRLRSDVTVPLGDQADADLPGDRIEFVAAPPTLLFRYSAVTFNSHRIHYDADYARMVEGYPGVVVHGPLQSTLLMRLAHAHAQAPLSHFAFRHVSPLIGGTPFKIRARTIDTTSCDLWAIAADGRVATTARARW